MDNILFQVIKRYAGKQENALMKLLHEVSSSIGVSEHSYVVGGAVRDVAMDIDPKDVDVVVETRDGKDAYFLGKALADYLGIESSSVVADHYGVVHVGPVPHDFIYDGVNLIGQKIEIVTARKEYYERGKGQDWKPSKVEPGTIEDDLRRRDFTLNTLVFQLSQLAQGPDKLLIADILGMGLQDLNAKILRTPVDPDETFQEDPTRLLRAVRMVVKYGLKFDVATARAIRRNAEQLKRVPEEKINEEITKMLSGNQPKYAMKLLASMGLLQHILPELDKEKKTKGYKNLLNSLDKISPDITTRLAVIFSNLTKETAREIIKAEYKFYKNREVDTELVEQIMRRLRYPNYIVKTVTNLLQSQSKITGEMTDKELRQLQYEVGDQLENLLDLVHAINLSETEEHVSKNLVPRIRDRYTQMKEEDGLYFLERIKNPPFNGKQIMSLLGLHKGGPIVGEAMEYQKHLIISNPKITEDEIKREIQKEFQIA